MSLYHPPRAQRFNRSTESWEWFTPEPYDLFPKKKGHSRTGMKELVIENKKLKKRKH